MLSFLTPHGQCDMLVGPTDDVTLECDGATIWVADATGEHFASITAANAIDFWSRGGSIWEPNRQTQKQQH
jgi:hypothetical protein